VREPISVANAVMRASVTRAQSRGHIPSCVEATNDGIRGMSRRAAPKANTEARSAKVTQ